MRRYCTKKYPRLSKFSSPASVASIGIMLLRYLAIRQIQNFTTHNRGIQHWRSIHVVFHTRPRLRVKPQLSVPELHFDTFEDLEGVCREPCKDFVKMAQTSLHIASPLSIIAVLASEPNREFCLMPSQNAVSFFSTLQLHTIFFRHLTPSVSSNPRNQEQSATHQPDPPQRDIPRLKIPLTICLESSCRKNGSSRPRGWRS